MCNIDCSQMRFSGIKLNNRGSKEASVVNEKDCGLFTEVRELNFILQRFRCWSRSTSTLKRWIKSSPMLKIYLKFPTFFLNWYLMVLLFNRLNQFRASFLKILGSSTPLRVDVSITCLTVNRIFRLKQR